MFRITWIIIWAIAPDAINAPRRSGAFVAINEKSPYQEKKQQDDNACAHQPQFLTNDGEDHIILRLRQKPQFLYAVPQPPPEQAAASDRIQPLKRLVAFLILFRITP